MEDNKHLQKELSAKRHEAQALMAEMESTAQAFEEMQEQNIRLLQQLKVVICFISVELCPPCPPPPPPKIYLSLQCDLGFFNLPLINFMLPPPTTQCWHYIVLNRVIHPVWGIWIKGRILLCNLFVYIKFYLLIYNDCGD